MRRRILANRYLDTRYAVFFAFIVCALDSSAAWFWKSKPGETAARKDYETDIKPLLAKYCYDCHGETKPKGDISLQAYQNKDAVLKDRATWEKVLHNVRTSEMPPPKKPQPTEQERSLIANWIEADVFGCDCENPDPGRVTLRRLNRAEYNNTIRDLLGVDFHPADDFPVDDSGYGFDNIGDVLSLPPILLEKYMSAAEKVLDKAIVTEFTTLGPKTRFEAEKISFTEFADIFQRRLVRLGRESEVFTPFQFPKSGNYILRAKAYGDQAGDEPARMEFRINGEIVKTFDVIALESSPAIYEVHFKAGAGSNTISAAYINNFRDPTHLDPDKRDRNLIIDYLEILGPSGPVALPATHQSIFARPIPISVEGKKTYAREIIGNFGQRAFRRPLSPAEIDRLVAFVDMAQSEGENFETGIKLTMQAMLVSPHFLFRGEIQPDPNNAKAIHPIDEFALASRLSYFLWSSLPDEELFRLAERGKLRKNLESQVRRMLRDKKASAFVENFAGQWLQIRNLDLMTPDSGAFPQFDEALRSAMRKETELLFESLLKENRSVLELLNANYTFVNERLARHYEIPGISGDHFRRVSLKGTARGGILTHASILTLTSNPTRTSPVKRGKWVLENILGTPPPPPPPDVPDLKEEKEVALAGTLRERIEQHRDNPNCSSCHARMDPIGFAFENFDGIGAWRNQDGDSPIDSSGELVSGESFSGASEFRQILIAKKKEEFVRCLVEKLLTYALGRGMEMYDKCAIDEISKRLAKRDYKFGDLILEITKSVPFQLRRGEEQLAETFDPSKSKTASR